MDGEEDGGGGGEENSPVKPEATEEQVGGERGMAREPTKGTPGR